jgi:hypothetical protein
MQENIQELTNQSHDARCQLEVMLRWIEIKFNYDRKNNIDKKERIPF